MAITIAQSKAGATLGTSSASIVFTGSVAENDLLVVHVLSTSALPTSGYSVSDPNGTWSLLCAPNYAENTSAGIYMAAWYRVVGPGETWTPGTTAITVNFGTNTSTTIEALDYTGFVGKPEVDPNWSTYSGGGYQVSLIPTGTGATKTLSPAPPQFTSGFGYVMVGAAAAANTMGNGSATPTVNINGAGAFTPSSFGVAEMGSADAWMIYGAGCAISNNGSGNSVVWVEATGRQTAGWAVSFVDTGVYADSGTGSLTLTGSVTGAVDLSPAASVALGASATETYSEGSPATLTLSGTDTPQAVIAPTGSLTLTAGPSTETYSETSPGALTLTAGATDTTSYPDTTVETVLTLTGGAVDSYQTPASMTLAASGTDNSFSESPSATLTLTAGPITETYSEAAAATLALAGTVVDADSGAATLSLTAGPTTESFSETSPATITLAGTDTVKAGVTGTTTVLTLTGFVIDESGAASIALTAGPISESTSGPNAPADPLLGTDGLLILSNLWNAAKTGYHYSGAELSYYDMWTTGGPPDYGLFPEWDSFKLTTGQTPAIVNLNADYLIAYPFGPYAGLPTAGFTPFGTLVTDWANILSGVVEIVNDSGTIQYAQDLYNPTNYFLGNILVSGATSVASVNASGVLATTTTPTSVFGASGGTGVIQCTDSDGILRLHHFTYTSIVGNAFHGMTIYGDQAGTIANHAITTANWLNGPKSNLVDASQALMLQWSPTAYVGMADAYGTALGTGPTDLGNSGSYAAACAVNANGNLNDGLSDVLPIITELNNLGMTFIVRMFSEINSGAQWASENWFNVLWQYCVGFYTGENLLYDGNGNPQPILSTGIASISSSSGTATMTLVSDSPLESGQPTTISGIPASNPLASVLNGQTVTVTKTSLPGNPTVVTFPCTTSGTYTPGQFDTPMTTTPAHNMLFALIGYTGGGSLAGMPYPPANLVDLIGCDIYGSPGTIAGYRHTMQGQPGYSNIPWGVTEWSGTSTLNPAAVAFFQSATNGIESGSVITAEMLSLSGDQHPANFPASGVLAIPTDAGIQQVTYTGFTIASGTQPGSPQTPCVMEFTVGLGETGNPLAGGAVTLIDSSYASDAQMLNGIKAANASDNLPYAAWFSFWDNGCGLSQLYQDSAADMTTFMTDSSIKNLGSGLSGYRDQGAATLALTGMVNPAAQVPEQTTIVALAAGATDTFEAEPTGSLSLSGSVGAESTPVSGGAFLTLSGVDAAAAEPTAGAELFLAYLVDVAVTDLTTDTPVIALTGGNGPDTVSASGGASIQLDGEVFDSETSYAYINIGGGMDVVEAVATSAATVALTGFASPTVPVSGGPTLSLSAPTISADAAGTAGATLSLSGLVLSGYRGEGYLTVTAEVGFSALTVTTASATFYAVPRNRTFRAVPPNGVTMSTATPTATTTPTGAPGVFLMGAAEEQTFEVDLSPDLDDGQSVTLLSAILTSVDTDEVVDLAAEPVLLGDSVMQTIDGAVDEIVGGQSYLYRVLFIAAPSTGRFAADTVVQVSP